MAVLPALLPGDRATENVIASGEIGFPVVAQMNAFERFNPASDDPRHWLVRSAQAGGGPMFDFGCHRIEVLLDLFGPVRRVTGMTANVVFAREVEDTAAALFHFERGACATLTVTHAANDARDTFDVFGTSGSVRIRQLNSGHLNIRTQEGERDEAHPPAGESSPPAHRRFRRRGADGPRAEGDRRDGQTGRGSGGTNL